MLADHDLMRAPEHARIEGFIGARILEQPIDVNAGFMGEDMFADDGLVERDRSPRRRGDERRDVTQFSKHDAGFIFVELTRRHGDFFERRIAGALAEPDHGDRRMRRARPNARQCVGGGETQIVVTVDFDFKVARRAQFGDQFERGERIEHAQRVGDPKSAGAGGLRDRHRLHQEFRLGARRILAANRDVQALVPRVGDDAPRHLQRLGAPAAQFRADLRFGDRHRQIDHRDARRQRRVDVLDAHPAPSDRAQRQSGVDDRSDHRDLHAAHRRRSGFEFSDAGARQGARNFEFFCAGESDARGLFAIPQRGVVQHHIKRSLRRRSDGRARTR